MKAHKYWSLGALACMAGCFYTGCKKLMQAHKYFACGSLVCIVMAIYSGHKIAPKKKKAEKPETKNAPLLLSRQLCFSLLGCSPCNVRRSDPADSPLAGNTPTPFS